MRIVVALVLLCGVWFGIRDLRDVRAERVPVKIECHEFGPAAVPRTGYVTLEGMPDILAAESYWGAPAWSEEPLRPGLDPAGKSNRMRMIFLPRSRWAEIYLDAPDPRPSPRTPYLEYYRSSNPMEALRPFELGRKSFTGVVRKGADPLAPSRAAGRRRSMFFTTWYLDLQGNPRFTSEDGSWVFIFGCGLLAVTLLILEFRRRRDSESPPSIPADAPRGETWEPIFSRSTGGWWQIPFVLVIALFIGAAAMNRSGRHPDEGPIYVLLSLGLLGAAFAAFLGPTATAISTAGLTATVGLSGATRFMRWRDATSATYSVEEGVSGDRILEIVLEDAPGMSLTARVMLDTPEEALKWMITITSALSSCHLEPARVRWERGEEIDLGPVAVSRSTVRLKDAAGATSDTIGAAELEELRLDEGRFLTVRGRSQRGPVNVTIPAARLRNTYLLAAFLDDLKPGAAPSGTRGA